MSAAKKVAIAALTIGGLPVERFEGRRVKVTLSDGITTTAVCRGAYKKLILVDVVIDGRLRQYQCAPNKVKPFWVDNPDLHIEAKNLGILFDGDVNVGRALEEANAKSAADALAKAKAELAEAAARKAAARAARAEALAEAEKAEAANAAKVEKEVLEVLAKAEVAVNAAPPQTPEVPKPSFADVTGVTACMTADPTWVSDFADLQSLLNERKGRHGRIAELQAKLVALETELASLGSSFEDDEEMITLYAESLLQKGATLHWTSPAEPALSWTAPAAAVPSYLPKPGSFEAKLADWLVTSRPVSFNYQDVWDALGVGDQPTRRSMVCRLANSDYVVIPSARGKPQLFVRKDGQGG